MWTQKRKSSLYIVIDLLQLALIISLLYILMITSISLCVHLICSYQLYTSRNVRKHNVFLYTRNIILTYLLLYDSQVNIFVLL